MNVILLEDDREHCEEYQQYVTQLQGVQLSVAYGYKQGMELLQHHLPDILLLDLELHNSDGDGVSFLRDIRNIELKSRPYIIVITVNIAHKTHALVRKYGVDYIITKDKPDYSPKFVIDFAYQYFICQGTELIPDTPLIREDSIKSQIEKAIESVGITHDMDGKDYLVEGIVIALQSGKKDLQLSRDVYPQIARKYKKSDWSIERAIRNAIIKAWRITDLRILAKNYTAEVDFAKGMPTNKEFIFYFYDKFKA